MAALSQTAASVIPSASARRHHRAGAPAAVTIAAGQAINFNTATSTWRLADADVALGAQDIDAIAGCSAAAGQRCDPIIEDDDFTHGLDSVAAGDTIWTFTTAGAFTKTIGDLGAGVFTSVAMVCISATKAKVRIVKSGVAHA